MGNIIFSLIWLIILIVVGFWIASVIAPIYIILQPFAACIDIVEVSIYRTKTSSRVITLTGHLSNECTRKLIWKRKVECAHIVLTS